MGRWLALAGAGLFWLPAGATPPAAAHTHRLVRALDPTGAVPGSVSIYFEFYRHSAPGSSRGTLVATEGGPGYPATESRDDYLALFGPLMGTRDVLIMDNRGTGQSGALDCTALQTGERWTEQSVAECGNSLGARAPLYSTAYAADDLAAVLESLRIRKIDLYGDSYGTYFEQVFATRHPKLLRSIILDGAYPLTGPDYAWYPSYAPAMREKFNLACARTPACAALPGDSIAHIEPALELLRAQPFDAAAYDSDGKQRSFRADASQLAIVMYGSAPKLTTAREVDAAARAFAEGDRLPLLRLMAETLSAVDSRDPSADPKKWSAGLAAAVMCQDPPQIFDMSLPPAQRLADRERVLAERRATRPDTYAPFSIDEYRGMPLDYSFLDQCVGWPAAPPTHRASQIGVNAHYPDVPALVISGEFDNITTSADGAAVAAAFPRGVQVRIANSFHVNALPRARSSCGAELAQRFIEKLNVGDASCAARVPPINVVARFARQSAELAPATALEGNAATPTQLHLAAAAVLTAADVLARAANAELPGTGKGLRGGTFAERDQSGDLRVTLDAVRWTDDVAVSGVMQRTAGQIAVVHGDLQFTSSNASTGRLTVRWVDGTADQDAAVRIEGMVDGQVLEAVLPSR